jgi:hypothetical protein
MNTTTAYTPLESLLLFQSLTVYGTDPDVFIRTSHLLKTNTLIRDGKTFDPGRLSPDALRELYLQLLREELRLEATQGEGKGDASPTRKRKLASPQLPTIKDANEYSEKLPQLVDRLYGRYRELMIRSIREDEQKYDTLQHEIAEIERGEWDERILKEDRGRSKRTPSVALEESRPTKATGESPVPGVLQDGQQIEALSDSAQRDGQQPQKDTSPSPVPAAREVVKPESLVISDVLSSREPSPPKVTEPLPVSEAENPLPILPPLGHQETSSQDKLPVPPPIQPVQQPPPENWRWEQYQGAPLPHQQAPYPANSSYPQFSQPQYPPYPQGPHRGSFSVPSGHALLTPQGHVPSSPINNNHPPPVSLPPPSIGSPGTQHLNQLADAAEQQQYRPTSASPSAPQSGVPGAQYGQPYPAYPTYMNDGRPLTGNGTPPQWNPNYAPPYPPPPNNHTYPPPPAGQQPFSTTPNIIQPGQRQYYSPYNPSQGPRPFAGSSLTPRPLQLRGVDSFPHTPASFGSAPNLTGMGTRWTPTPTASTPKVPKSPVQPTYELLSPVLTPAILPPQKNAKTPKNSAKGKKTDPKANASSTSQPRIKKQRANKRTKAGSPASSAIAGSLRSQSVMSHADELSLVNDATSGINVKEETATPMAVEYVGETTAEESNKNLVSETVLESPRRPLKRKRHDSPPREPSGPPTHVLWTRNFPKISASALERIGAHRSASTFALPIKERDAPGYSNLILRPQDLKSIRAAINSGYKAGLAIASTMGDQGQTNMLLPISEDLIPPKGIVNNAQLEKELMRIFSNAIMFNHDPHRSFGKAFEAAKSIEESAGAENYKVDENQLVNDTRAMFTDVEKIVGEMRSAERRQEGVPVGEAEEDEADELAGEAEAATGSIVKRRRRA